MLRNNINEKDSLFFYFWVHLEMPVLVKCHSKTKHGCLFRLPSVFSSLKFLLLNSQQKYVNTLEDCALELRMISYLLIMLLNTCPRVV